MVAEVEGGPFCWTLAVRDPRESPDAMRVLQPACAGAAGLGPLSGGRLQGKGSFNDGLLTLFVW